jgi:hypothetical protein
MKVETQNFLKKGYSAKGSKRILWHACLQLQERRKAGAMRIAHTHRTLLALHYAQNPITHMKS